jgi:acyl-CoA synthetase (AMP-forming)/AMP-acid ligase II
LDLDYPRVTLYEFLDTSARRFPDKPAIIFYGKRINYSEVKDLTDRLATFFV